MLQAPTKRTIIAISAALTLAVVGGAAAVFFHSRSSTVSIKNLSDKWLDEVSVIGPDGNVTSGGKVPPLGLIVIKIGSSGEFVGRMTA